MVLGSAYIPTLVYQAAAPGFSKRKQIVKYRGGISISKIINAKTALGMDVKPKSIMAGEAHAIWNFLNLRYLYIEMTEIFSNYITDTEFKMIVKNQVSSVLNKQIKELENLHKTYQIVLPPTPPTGINTAVNSEAMRDEMMYRIILVGIQYFLETHTETLRMMSNDSLRNLFTGYMEEEMKVLDNVIKYGKLKGWYWGAPTFQY